MSQDLEYLDIEASWTSRTWQQKLSQPLKWVVLAAITGITFSRHPDHRPHARGRGARPLARSSTCAPPMRDERRDRARPRYASDLLGVLRGAEADRGRALPEGALPDPQGRRAHLDGRGEEAAERPPIRAASPTSRAICRASGPATWSSSRKPTFPTGCSCATARSSAAKPSSRLLKSMPKADAAALRARMEHAVRLLLPSPHAGQAGCAPVVAAARLGWYQRRAKWPKNPKNPRN